MSTQPDEATDATEPVGQFKLDRLLVRKVVFEEIPLQPSAEGEKRPPRVPLGLQFKAGIGSPEGDTRRAIVSLEVVVTPDPRWQPYRIGVTVAGIFSGEDVTEAEFDQFCRLGVPPILFPYVREIVHHLTADALFGPIHLDPVNLSVLLGSWTSTEAPRPEP